MDLPREFCERDLKKAIIFNMKNFILEIGKDEKVVEYAMSRSLSPTMVSEYTLKLIDKKLLENKLKEISCIVDENNNQDH